MILKASLFRLSNFAYETATKKKLNLFINTIIFISIFAISAASLSLFYENKIDEIDRKIILAESQKILLENQISVVPNSLNSINLIENAQLKDQSNIDILRDVDGSVLIRSLVTQRNVSFEAYYQLITLADILTQENRHYFNTNKYIFKNDTDILNKISEFEKINERNNKDVWSIYSKISKVEEDWETFEKDNIVSKKGSFGFFMDIHPDGILVEEIVKNTPASNSELKAGDIILSINGKTFKNLKDKFQIDVNVKPNLPAEFIVKSKGRTKKIIIIPEEQFNDDLHELKNKNYYNKFDQPLKDIKNIINEQKEILLTFGLSYTIENLEKINSRINRFNKELENISKNEARTILFAFIIQLIIFFSSQYFEFSIGQINEKKNLKK